MTCDSTLGESPITIAQAFAMQSCCESTDSTEPTKTTDAACEEDNLCSMYVALGCDRDVQFFGRVADRCPCSCTSVVTEDPMGTVTYHQDQQNFCQEFTFVADDCNMLYSIMSVDGSFSEGPCMMRTTCPPEFDSLAEEAMAGFQNVCADIEYSYFCEEGIEIVDSSMDDSYIIADQTSCMDHSDCMNVYTSDGVPVGTTYCYDYGIFTMGMANGDFRCAGNVYACCECQDNDSFDQNADNCPRESDCAEICASATDKPSECLDVDQVMDAGLPSGLTCADAWARVSNILPSCPGPLAEQCPKTCGTCPETTTSSDATEIPESTTTTSKADNCADTVCPMVVCSDGSEPPIPDRACCGSMADCPADQCTGIDSTSCSGDCEFDYDSQTCYECLGKCGDMAGDVFCCGEELMCIETPRSDGFGVDYSCGEEQVCADLPSTNCGMNDYCVFDYSSQTCEDCPGKCQTGTEYECCGNHGGVCETVLDQFGMETEQCQYPIETTTGVPECSREVFGMLMGALSLECQQVLMASLTAASDNTAFSCSECRCYMSLTDEEFLEATGVRSQSCGAGSGYSFYDEREMCEAYIDSLCGITEICQGDEEPTIDIDFSKANVLRANLGGQTDPTDVAEIYYQNIATLNDRRVNLRITTDDNYACKQCDNVQSNQFGQINMKGESTITVTFSFIYDDDAPVDLGLIYLTFFDLDGKRGGVEELTLLGVDGYIVSDVPKVTLTSGTDWVKVANSYSLAEDDNVANPVDLFALTEEQKSVSIAGRWRNVNTIQAMLTVRTFPNSHRFMMFAGATSLLNLCSTCESSGVCDVISEKPSTLCHDGVTNNCNAEVCSCTDGTETTASTTAPECSDDDNAVHTLFADWMGISHCASVNLEVNGIECDTSFQRLIDDGMGWIFTDERVAQRYGNLRSLCGCTCERQDRCSDVVCPAEVCEDGSEPPVPEDSCCGDLDMCPAYDSCKELECETCLDFALYPDCVFYAGECMNAMTAPKDASLDQFVFDAADCNIDTTTIEAADRTSTTTTTTTTSSSTECEAWCYNRSHPWSEKCTYIACGGCDECGSVDTTTTIRSAGTCPKWCGNNYDRNCQFAKCVECPTCLAMTTLTRETTEIVEETTVVVEETTAMESTTEVKETTGMESTTPIQETTEMELTTAEEETTTTSKAPEGTCLSWCPRHTALWEVKCEWNTCSACFDCLPCENWCERNANDWSSKCRFDACAGCSACATKLALG